jgi:ubiquinone/menaquinone biosynthesis C-methylase UbiE
MAERVHPEDPGFRQQWKLSLRCGFFPWLKRIRSPYRDAFRWRYGLVARACKGKDVLDIPCGMGWGTSMLGRSRRLVGVDLSEEAIREARQRYGGVATFLVGDMGNLDLPSTSFDMVVCLEGIEHVPPDVARLFLQESCRVLREGGELYMSSPFCVTGEHSGNPYHIKEYRPEEMHALVQPYFEVVSVLSRPVDNLIVSMFHLRRRR